MNFKAWIFGLCALCLGAYLALYSAIFYSYPPIVVVSYGVYGEGLPFGPPRGLVMQYALCCKDLGRKDTDEHKLIPMLINIGRAERERGDLVDRAEGAIRSLVQEKELSVNWLDPRTGTTAFHQAVMSYEPWAVELLLELGADPCVRISHAALNHQGQNALELAINLTSGSVALSEEDQQKLSALQYGPLVNTIPLLEEVSRDCR